MQGVLIFQAVVRYTQNNADHIRPVPAQTIATTAECTQAENVQPPPYDYGTQKRTSNAVLLYKLLQVMYL